MILKILVIIWIVFCVLISALLKIVILRSIHKKALVNQTVIDLSYADCFLLLLCFDISFSFSVVLCLISSPETLSFGLSFVLAVLIDLILGMCLNSLTITGCLRLVTVVSNLEQAGIQILGPDYKAIWMIRWLC